MSGQPPLPLVAGRYRVATVIGRGAMGQVWRAHDERLDREVAVKFLRADLAAEPTARSRFEEEARSAARLGHPNAVTVFDTGEERGVAYIVMECLPGHTVADEIARGPIEVVRARALIGEVLGALGAAHELGVLHRDIKPSNILLTVEGHAKLADFGIAKSTEGLHQTMTGEVVGTPAYMAPERLDGEPATPRSDLYSVGVVLYEVLTGRVPFAGATPMAVMRSVLSGEITPIGELDPSIDPALAQVIERSMDGPAHRFQSAAAFRAALAPGAVLVDDALAPTVQVRLPAATTRLRKEAATAVFPTGPALPVPAPRARDPRAHHGRWRAGVAFVVALVAGYGLVQLDDGGPSPIPRPPTTGATGTTAPSTTPASEVEAALEAALDALERLVEP